MAGRQWWTFKGHSGHFRRTLLDVFVHEDFHEWIRAKGFRLSGEMPSDRGVLSVVKRFLLTDTTYREDDSIWTLTYLTETRGLWLSLSLETHGGPENYVDTDHHYYRKRQACDLKVTA